MRILFLYLLAFLWGPTFGAAAGFLPCSPSESDNSNSEFLREMAFPSDVPSSSVVTDTPTVVEPLPLPSLRWSFGPWCSYCFDSFFSQFVISSCMQCLLLVSLFLFGCLTVDDSAVYAAPFQWKIFNLACWHRFRQPFLFIKTRVTASSASK